MSSSQKPRAFRLSPEPPPIPGVVPPPERATPTPVIVEEPFEIVDAADGVPVPVAPRSRSPWGALFWSAAGGLVSLGIGLSIERMITNRVI